MRPTTIPSPSASLVAPVSPPPTTISEDARGATTPAGLAPDPVAAIVATAASAAADTSDEAPVPAPDAPAPDAPAAVAAGAEAAVQALVARAQAGDQAAFSGLYELYAPRVLRYLRNQLGFRPGAPAVAEDLTADVFLRTLEKLPGYCYRGAPFAAWLYRVAHNRLIDHLRVQPKVQVATLDACGALADPSATHALDGALDQAHLAGVLARLTADQQAVIRHRFLQDRSLADTARLLGKHEDAVKQLQVRALRSMRRALTGTPTGMPAAA